MPPKRKKRFHGLYYHSSPPRVLPMNGQGSTETKKKSADDFSVRLSTIRIWMHEKDIGKLTRVLWAGQGNRLRQQASTNPRVKRFLAAVPYVMNTIKDVHQSVVDNSLETLQATMEPPVPPSLITSKDLNGLNVIHKAAGLGHTMILEYLLSIWPDGVHETDMTGKTPLHWAASAKNNMRCYTLLTQAGCEEDALDYKMKTPAYYKQKHNEIERSFLTLVPEAPRVSQDIPTDWDALANDDSDERKKPEIKIPNGRAKSDIVGNGMNLLTSRSEANSIENTSEPDLFEGDKSTEEASEPQPPEPIVNGNEENPSENNHLENSVGDNSEPPSPPKTPEEKTDENHTEEESEVDEPPQPTASQQEDENVSIALSDQNNDDQNTNDNNDETEEGNDMGNDDENGDSNENDKSEGYDGNIEEEENREDTKENDVNTEENNGDEENEEEDEEKSDENPDEEEVQGETGNEDEREDNEEVNCENSKSLEQDNAVEKDDETNSVKENNEENSEEIGENKTESQVRDDETTEEGNDHTSETEQDNETESTPLEDSQTVEEDSENIQPERPKTRDENPEEQNEDSPQTPANETSDEEHDTELVENKINEPQEPQKENDDDDDAQDTQIETLPEPPTEPELEKDENENIPEFDDKMATDSPTSSLAIEGYVLGDSEDNQVQSESAAILDDEEKYIQAIINAGDMEQLAALVLNGDGKKILNRTSSQPEIQAFLNNVPAYMNKISRVHEAARQGTLYQLQSALDRRKFAIAKDAMSPCGASPLHVAVLFGHADIVRYLAGRFPETTSAVDDDGRTPLHYAATIKDNGHFFNLLCHLGGNPRAVDKFGHTADFYTNTDEAKDVLTYKKLLQRFGAETLEDEMLSDQVPDDQHSSRRNMVDVDVLSTLERCFSVIHEASKNLSSASASALATRSPATPSSVQVSVTCYLGKFLRRSVFDKIKKRQTRLDHNLFDVIWPAMRKVPKERITEDDLNHGVIAPDYDVYVVFQEFMVPLIKDMHCMNMSSEFKPHPRISYFPFSNGERMTQVQFMLDDESKLIAHCTVECSRNLEGFELPLNLNVAQIEQAERAMMAKIFTTNFAKAIGDHEAGNYYTLNEVIEKNSTIFKMLDNAGLMIPLFDLTDRMQEGESLAINGQLWPYGRGVFVNVKQNLALWLNCQEHLRVISSTKGDGEAANIGKAYSKVGRAVTYLEINLHFKESYLLGYLVSRPSYLGTGLKMTTTIQLPNLLKEVDNLRHLCSVRGLLMNNCASKNLVSLINMQSLGSTEITLFRDYCTAVTNIISLEKDMSLTNSKHIATMLVKIFRRKKNSLVDRN